VAEAGRLRVRFRGERPSPGAARRAHGGTVRGRGPPPGKEPMSTVTPFSLDLALVGRMVNAELARHPVYKGVEVQWYDDARHGRGLVVFLSRTGSGLTDVYREAGLTLDPSLYAIGAGLGEWRQTEFEPGRLDVDASGVAVEVSFDDVDGRTVEISLDDRGPGERRWARFLAPMGAEVEQPHALPLVWMSRFDLVRRRGHGPRVRIGGERVETGRLPGERLLGRRLIKVASDLCVVSVLPDGGGHPEQVATPGPDGGLEAFEVSEDDHRARLAFDPPFPALDSLRDRSPATGVWRVRIDGSPLAGGSYTATRRGGTVDVDLEVTEGWRPEGLPPLMKVVTTVVPVFRRWPTTYRWHGTVALDGGETSGGWHRIGSSRASSYRSLTRSSQH